MISGKLWVTMTECYAALRHVWRPNTGCCEHWFNPIANPSLCQFTCQQLLLLACSFSWEDCSYAWAPGRPTRESSIYSSSVPRRGSRGAGRNAVRRRREEDRLSPAVGSFTNPSLPLSLSLYGFLLSYFEHVCCGENVHEGTDSHTCTHTNTHTLSYPVSVVSLSPTGEQRPAVSDGGDLPFRVSC